MIDLRPVIYLNGLFLIGLAATMAIPAIVDLNVGNEDWIVFAASSGFTLFFGVAAALATRQQNIQIDVRQGFLLTTSSWVTLAAFGALPFVFSGLDLSLADAYFESMSGLTTTGSTVIVGLDRLPPGLQLWRGVLNFVGGAGLILLAMVVLPFLRVGGMQLFHSESSDRSEKVVPRLSTVASATLFIYLTLAITCALLYWFAGMTGMEAVVHAMASVSTGGFSTSDSSIGFFQSAAVEWIGIAFMLAGALPFVIYIRLTRGDISVFWKDSQIRLLFLIVLGSAVALTLWLSLTRDMHWAEAFRHALFNVTSVVTTTGFVSTDYSQWGSFAVTVFFLLTFSGGCTGSTSGGIKIFRFEILLARLRVQMAKLVQPHGVFPLQYQGRVVPDDVPAGVIAFIALYISCFVILALLLAAMDLDFVTAVSGAATALGNVGPGLGPIIGPAGTFQPLPDAAKWLLAFAMVLGRLELFTFLVLFTPRFWRH